jgi:phage terminase large subunit
LNVQLPDAFRPLFGDSRYCIFYGGRGSGKSWAVAIGLVLLAASKPLRIVCAREFQNSIDESVHHLLAGRIRAMGLEGPNGYTIEKYRIHHACGSEFIFKGLSKQDAAAVKSLEGADICWVEEAQGVSEASWRNLTPTVRKDGSRIIVTFNPDTEESPTYQRFVLKPPSDAVVVKVNWNDNPWFPAVLEQERLDMLALDPVTYQNVWEGEPRSFSEGAIFKEEMASLERAGRIGDVPYDPNKGVYTWWDMSHSASHKGDPNAVTFVQVGDGTGLNVIDYWEGNGVGLGKVGKDVILGRDYNYLGHFLPHDGARTNNHTEKTDDQFLTDLGLKNVQLVERTPSLQANVNQLRLLLPRLRIDRDKCKTLIGALKSHRMERNDKTGVWTYRHDWTSHGVSTLRGLAGYGDRMQTNPQPFIKPDYSWVT